jgi:hypothetical protein
VALLVATPSAAAVEDPARVNQILGVQRLQMVPGETRQVVFSFSNPYDGMMRNASLRMEIYRYVSGEDRRDVDGTWNAPHFQESGGSSLDLRLEGEIGPGASHDGGLPFTVVTSADQPHGSVFRQGTYMVRFLLEFELRGGSTPGNYTMVSLGFFTLEQWVQATREPTPDERTNYRYVGDANYTYLGSVLGLPPIDGILADYAFGVKAPMPLWPFYALGAAGGFLLLLAGALHVVENPQHFPRLAPLLRRFTWRRR